MRSVLEDYLQTQRYVKPAWIPRQFTGRSEVACPQGCGFCDRHEQHLCLPIVEITSRCDLSCPVCLVDASRMMDCLANRTIFGLDEEEQDNLKDMIYELWSGPAGSTPDTATHTPNRMES